MINLKETLRDYKRNKKIIDFATGVARYKNQRDAKQQLQEWLEEREHKTEQEEKALKESRDTLLVVLSVTMTFAFLFGWFFFPYIVFRNIGFEKDTACVLAATITVFLTPLCAVILRPFLNLTRKNWVSFIYKVSNYIKNERRVRKCAEYNTIVDGVEETIAFDIVSFDLSYPDSANAFVLLSKYDLGFEDKWKNTKTTSYFRHELKITLVGILFVIALYGGSFAFACYHGDLYGEESQSPIEVVKEINQEYKEYKKYGHVRGDLERKVNGDGLMKAEVLEKITSSKEGDIYCYYYEEENEYATKAVFVYCTEEDDLPAVIVTKKEGDWYFVEYEVPKTKQFGEKEWVLSVGEKL